MSRTVKATLEADVKGFVEPVDRAANKTDDLKDKVEGLDRSLGKLPADSAKAGAGLKGLDEEAGKAKRSTDELGDQVDQLDRSLNKIPADASKAAAAMALLKGDVSELDHSFEAVGDKSTAFTVLERRISSARSEVKKLTDEFLKSGDLDVFQKLGKAQGDLSFLEGFRKKMSNSVEGGLRDGISKAGPEAASTFASLFQGGIIKSLSNPYVAAAAAGLAAVLGSFVLSAVGGAIIAAGAVGVAGAGVAGAFMQSEQVKRAWNGAIDSIQSKWMTASSTFIKPLIDGAGTFKHIFADVNLYGMFEKASTFIGPLVEGASWFAKNIITGIGYLVDNGGPVIEVLRRELPELGAAIMDMFQDIAGGNKGAADGLRDMFNLIEQGIRGLGVMVEAAEKMYHGFTGARDAVGDFFSYLDDHVPVIFKAADAVSNFWEDADTEKVLAPLRDANGVTKELGENAANSKEAFDALGQKMNLAGDLGSAMAKKVQEVFSITMNADQATLGWYESLTKLEEAFDKNGHTIDIHTKKGQANREAILSTVTANMQLYQAQIAAGMGSDDAAAAYDQNTKALEKQLRQAHYTQGEIDGLIGKYRGIPSKVNTLIATENLTKAINDLAALTRQINGIPTSKTIYVKTIQQYQKTTAGGLDMGLGHQGAGRYGAIRMAQGGTVVNPSNPGTFLFGEPETGGEAFIPLRGIPQMRAMSLAQTVGDRYGFDAVPRGGGGGAVVVKVEASIGGTNRELAGLLLEMQRRGDLPFVVKAG